MARYRRLWLVAAFAALLALVIELVGWLVPQLLRAIREPAYVIQFCLVLGINTDTACVTVKYQHSPGGTDLLYLYPDQTPERQGTLVQRQAYTGQYQIGFEYPCYYKGSNQTVATFMPPPNFDGLYLSFLVAVCVLAVLVSVVCMATRLPRYTSLLVPIRTALIPQAPVSSAAIPVLAQPISDRAAEALRQTDENLKKRIITLAIKVDKERDARIELEQRLSQTLEVVSASRYQQSPLRRNTRSNAVVPFDSQMEDV